MPKILMRRDTAANWSSVNPVLGSGEWGLETDSGKMKLGDGSSAWNALGYYTKEDDEWEKPSDWPDIRSGALPNSIYLLVGHKVDYSAYGVFSITASVGVNASGETYDVYVDGVKVVTAASSSNTTIDWQASGIKTGVDITYPESLRAHVIRITPTNKEIDKLAITVPAAYTYSDDILWLHNTAKYTALTLSYEGRTSRIEAITSVNNIISWIPGRGFYVSFRWCNMLRTLPVIIGNEPSTARNAYQCFEGYTYIKKISLKNVYFVTSASAFGYGSIEELDFENVKLDNLSPFDHATKLKKLPNFTLDRNATTLSVSRLDSLQDTIFDLNQFDKLTKLTITGASSNKSLGIKGITVSQEAPFNNSTSPQLNVNYTGLDRSALINLFESMPSLVGYTVVGSPTIESGIMSNISNTNYVQSKVKFPSDVTNFEFVTKFNATEYGTCIVSAPSSTIPFHLSLRSGGVIRLYPGAESVARDTSFVFSLNTAYYVKIVFENSTWKLLHSTDGTTYTQDISYVATASTIPHSNYVVMGRNYVNQGEPFQGSLDLSKTYIKINGLPWSAFDGITRTCSIVGCTGTSQLTQEDKNIALNKGWQLTVS